MNWYKEAKDFLYELSDVHTPEDLLEWMECIDYGWMDSDHKKRKGDFDENDFWDNYSMLLPNEVLEYKVGVCWDQTIFEAYVFKKLFDFETKTIFIQQYKVGTHTFLIYKKNDKWYHFENSFHKYRGIHGPYGSIEDIVEDVYDAMEKEDSGTGYEWIEMDIKDFTRKLSSKEFMDNCNYNYDEMEELKRDKK